MPVRTSSKLLLAALCLVPAVPMFAGPIPYPNSGTVAPATATYATGSNGVSIDLYYYGSNAGFNEGIQVYDVKTGFLSSVVLNNKTSQPGQEVTVGAGSINEGDQIVFIVDSPDGKFASEAAYSDDKSNHVYITDFAGGVVNGANIPAGLFLGFEDEPIKSSDLDYNDVEIVTTGVATTPEPSSFLLLGTGVMGMLGAARRRFA